MQNLASTHFKKLQKVDVTSLPVMARLSARLGEALTGGLSSIQPAPWRVTSDGISRNASEPGEREGSVLRFESAKGSLTAVLDLDRQSVSALLEVAMGGTGAEAAFEMNERPLSKIERRLLQHAYTKIATALASALGDVLDRPFELFHDAQTPAFDRSGGVVAFRFVTNVFSHSGELHLTFAQDEMERQIPIGLAEEAGAALPEAAIRLQQEVGKSEVTLTITLPEESLTLDRLMEIDRGTLIPLKATATGQVIVWSSGVAAYQATLGRSGDRFAITITSALT